MSILKRDLLYGVNGQGNARFSNWAVCVTTLGRMAEPYFPNTIRTADNNVPDYDPDDEIAKINSIREVNIDKEMQAISGGDHALIGGYLMPRLGR